MKHQKRPELINLNWNATKSLTRSKIQSTIWVLERSTLRLRPLRLVYEEAKSHRLLRLRAD